MTLMKRVLRNYTLLKLFFAALTVFLLYEELYIYSVEKPTHTSSARLRIGNRHIVSYVLPPRIAEPDDYPDITLCPFPSHNQTTLESYGYKNTYHYAKE